MIPVTCPELWMVEQFVDSKEHWFSVIDAEK